MSIDLRKLIQAGVPFGHPTSSWSPKMAPYIWGHKNKVYLIDVSKTAHQMQKSADFLKSIIMDGKSILWVGTKKPARDIIQANGINIKLSLCCSSLDWWYAYQILFK